MAALCEYFPGADTPINYDDCEDESSECSEDEYMQYDTQDSLADATLSQAPLPYDASSDPVSLRTADRTVQPPRPRSFVETQVSKLQHLMAAEAQPRTSALPKDEPDVHNRIGPVRIPQQFKKPEVYTEATKSAVPINRTCSSPDSLRPARSPALFSESSSPRLSPVAYRNVGNMNPRHADLECSRADDYSQTYCERLSAANSPMTPVKEYNGNLSQSAIDPRYQTPLQIEVDPVSHINVYLYLVLSLEDASSVVKIAQPVEDRLT